MARSIPPKKALLLLMIAVLANARLNQPQQAMLATDAARDNGPVPATDQVDEAENDDVGVEIPSRRLMDDIHYRSSSDSDEDITDENDDTPTVSHRIVGGTKVNTQRFPYFVSIRQTVGNKNHHVCGGTLIHDDIVLSAAHCADHAHTVRVGAYTALDDGNNGNQVYHDSGVIERIKHPDFYVDELKRLHYDFVLLRLAKPVTHPRLLRSMMQLDRVKAVDASLRDGNIGDSVTTIGLGRLYEDGPVPEILQEVELKYKSNGQCSRYFGEVSDEMMCAKDAYQDACSGDSGGPLIVTGDSPEEDVQIGVVSWGSGCAQIYPGVYARISKVADWIEGMICENSKVERPSYCPDVTCEDESHCQFYNSLLPGVWCYLNGNSCPVTCGKCNF